MARYARVNWENYPSTDTPLDADNLNQMDEAIDTINRELQQAKSLVTTLENRIKALNSTMSTFIRLEDGSTTGDMELINGRVGYDGTEYDTIGNAIRGQIEEALNDTSVDVSVSGRTLVFDLSGGEGSDEDDSD